jgi:hypothetical protein
MSFEQTLNQISAGMTSELSHPFEASEGALALIFAMQ